MMQNSNWWNSIMNKEFWVNTHKEVAKLMVKKYKKYYSLKKDSEKLLKFESVLCKDLESLIQTNCQFDYYHLILSNFCKLLEFLKKYSRLVVGLFTFLDKQLEVEEKR